MFTEYNYVHLCMYIYSELPASLPYVAVCCLHNMIRMRSHDRRIVLVILCVIVTIQCKQTIIFNTNHLVIKIHKSKTVNWLLFLTPRAIIIYLLILLSFCTLNHATKA